MTRIVVVGLHYKNKIVGFYLDSGIANPNSVIPKNKIVGFYPE